MSFFLDFIIYDDIAMQLMLVQCFSKTGNSVAISFSE